MNKCNRQQAKQCDGDDGNGLFHGRVVSFCFWLNATSFEDPCRLLRELYLSRVGLFVFVRAGMGAADSRVNAYFQLRKPSSAIIFFDAIGHAIVFQYSAKASSG